MRKVAAQEPFRFKEPLGWNSKKKLLLQYVINRLCSPLLLIFQMEAYPGLLRKVGPLSPYSHLPAKHPATHSTIRSFAQEKIFCF